MAAIIHPLLTLLASLTRQELARQVTYLPVQNALCKESLRVFSKNAFLAMFYGFRVWFGGAV
jgi:hypothetical protein